jgi:hypothetical protein
MNPQRYVAVFAALCGYPNTEYPMEDQMLARASRTKRRCVEFRRTRSPRELLTTVPFRQPSEGARMPVRPGTARIVAMPLGR